MEYLGRRDPSLVEKSANLGLPGKQALTVLICYFFHQLTIPQNSSEILSQTLYVDVTALCTIEARDSAFVGRRHKRHI